MGNAQSPAEALQAAAEAAATAEQRRQAQGPPRSILDAFQKVPPAPTPEPQPHSQFAVPDGSDEPVILSHTRPRRQHRHRKSHRRHRHHRHRHRSRGEASDRGNELPQHAVVDEEALQEPEKRVSSLLSYEQPVAVTGRSRRLKRMRPEPSPEPSPQPSPEPIAQPSHEDEPLSSHHTLPLGSSFYITVNLPLMHAPLGAHCASEPPSIPPPLPARPAEPAPKRSRLMPCREPCHQSKKAKVEEVIGEESDLERWMEEAGPDSSVSDDAEETHSAAAAAADDPALLSARRETILRQVKSKGDFLSKRKALNAIPHACTLHDLFQWQVAAGFWTEEQAWHPQQRAKFRAQRQQLFSQDDLPAPKTHPIHYIYDNWEEQLGEAPPESDDSSDGEAEAVLPPLSSVAAVRARSTPSKTSVARRSRLSACSCTRVAALTAREATRCHNRVFSEPPVSPREGELEEASNDESYMGVQEQG